MICRIGIQRYENHLINFFRRGRSLAAVLKAMLAMPFVLDDLAKDELEAYNSTLANPRNRIKNPFPGMIVTYNDYLHWYMLYRAKALIEPENLLRSSA